VPTAPTRKKKPEAESAPPKNQGKLILDATCAPADISYPTDLKLLNQARVQTEKILDELYKPLKEKINKKPRTYRKLARKEYLKVAKQRRPTRKQKRKAIKKQLQYIKRNLRHYQEWTAIRKTPISCQSRKKEASPRGGEDSEFY
jgi:hypothetical protein